MVYHLLYTGEFGDGSSVFEIFNTNSVPSGYYTFKGCLPSYPVSISNIELIFCRSTDGYSNYNPLTFYVSSGKSFKKTYSYSIDSQYSCFNLHVTLNLSNSYSSTIRNSVYLSLCASSESLYVVSNFIANSNKDISHHVASVSSGTSVGAALISSVGSSNATVGCIDASSVDKATKFYSVPLVDESNKQLILPDGSVVEFDDLVYDNDKRTYHITYDTSKTYTITYNYDNCVVNDGTAENIYYYAKVDANTPTYDKDGNQINGSGGSTTDPDKPSTDPDKPSDGGDDDNGSIWDKVVDAIAGLFTAIGKVIGGLLESVINLFTGIVDGLTGCLDLFGSFGEFVAGFYTWMPEEWRTVLAAAFTVFIGLAVIKLFRGS